MSSETKSKWARVLGWIPFLTSLRKKLASYMEHRRSERYRRQYRQRWTNPGSVLPEQRNFIERYFTGLALLIVAIGLLIGGLVWGGEGQVKPYLTNVLVQGAGVFVALGLAWLFFERHSQYEAAREFVGARIRIIIIRNWACTAITDLTSELFDEPPRLKDNPGPEYLGEHYEEIRQILGVGQGGSFSRLSKDINRTRRRFEWLFVHFIHVGKLCEDVMRLFGPALTRYPELLAAMDRFQNGVNGERESWRGFIDTEDEREKEHSTWRRGTEGYRDHYAEPPAPDDLPPDAINNLLTLATATISVVAAITHVLQDWDQVPNSDDVTMDSQIVYRATSSGPNKWGAQAIRTRI